MSIEKLKFTLMTSISRELAEFYGLPPEVEVSTWEDEVFIRVIQEVYGEKLETIQVPADWRWALYDRFAPAWLKRRRPTRCRIYDIMAYYPKLSHPADVIRMADRQKVLMEIRERMPPSEW